MGERSTVDIRHNKQQLEVKKKKSYRYLWINFSFVFSADTVHLNGQIFHPISNFLEKSYERGNSYFGGLINETKEDLLQFIWEATLIKISKYVRKYALHSLYGKLIDLFAWIKFVPFSTKLYATLRQNM